MEKAIKRYHEDEEFVEKVYRKAEAYKNKSTCFIATAAFGSPIADEVIVLRNWRDQILMRTFIGQKFIFFQEL